MTMQHEIDKILRRLRNLAMQSQDETLPDADRARAWSDFNKIADRHDIAMDDFHDLREREAEQANRAASYLDEINVYGPGGWKYSTLLEIARNLCAWKVSPRMDEVTRAYQENIITLARKEYRKRADDRKTATVTQLPRPQDIAA